MQMKIELTEREVRELVYDYLEKTLGDINFKKEDVQIQVKSKQNYRSEWESASFKAVVNYVE